MNLFDSVMANLPLEEMDPGAFQRFLDSRLQASCTLAPQEDGGRYAVTILPWQQARLAFIRCTGAAELRFDQPDGGLSAIIVSSGSVAIQATELQTCRRGDGYCLRTARPWGISATPGTRFCLLAFSAADTQRVLGRLTGTTATAPLDLIGAFQSATPLGRMVAALVTAVIAGSAESDPLAGAPISSALLKDTLLGLLLEAVAQGKAAHPSRNNAPGMPWQIRKAINFIRAHAPGDIAIADVAAAAEMSPRTLQQHFQRVFGKTPQDYVKLARLEAVRRELLDTSSKRSIEEVASDWGFANRGHFATQYRKIYGELPSRTRRTR